LTENAPSLTALQRAQYDEAKLRYRWRLFGHAGTLVAALVSAFAPAPVAYIFAVAALASESLAWWFRYDGARLKSLADEARRYVLIVEALGMPTDAVTYTSIRQRITKRAERSAAKFEHPTYYASKAPPGPRRLKECMQESAFWSAHLYRKAAWRALFLPFALTLLVFVILLVALPLAPRDSPLLIARALILVLAFIVASDEIGRVLDWYVAGNEADQIYRRLESINLASSEPILIAFADYEAITAPAPPIPNGVYEAHHQRLDALWQERCSN
jgi:hypothetical protein